MAFFPATLDTACQVWQVVGMSSWKASPLRAAILNSGLTQREIASRVGIHESSLSHIVRGRHADDRTRANLARVLNRDVADLWPEHDA